MASEAKDEARRERMSMLGAIGLLTFVSAVAIAVTIIVSIHNGNDAPRNGPHGVKLTAAESSGRSLFARTCANCHTLAAVNAVGRIGPNLDVLKPNKLLVLYAISQGFAGTAAQGQMPAGIYSGRDANEVASFVAAVAGR